MVPANEIFDSRWPFAPYFCEVAGFCQRDGEDGPGDREVIVYPPGGLASGYWYRDFIPRLGQRFLQATPR